MNYKIVADSSTDLTKEMKENLKVELVPLTMEVGGVRYVDDESLNISHYMKMANDSEAVPKTACPSPDQYMTAYQGEEECVFVVTLSSKLSGSYDSAVLAKKLFKEDHGDKKIHVFNSKSASSAQVGIVLKIKEYADQGLDYKTIIEKVNEYIRQQTTVFVLEKIEHLQKAGRLSKLATTIVNVLNIKLVLKDDGHGEIQKYTQARGVNKAITKMINSLAEVGTVTKDKFIVVAHCEAKERALEIKRMIEQKYNFREIIVVPMRGLSSNYANIGGIVMAF